MDAVQIIQIAEDWERKAAFAIREAVFIDEQRIDPLLEFDGLDDGADHLLATEGGSAVGTLRLRPISDKAAKIERVAVLKEARGRAVGAALIDAALQHLRARGFREVKLHAQTYALNFYAKHGFIVYGEDFDEDGIPHRTMRLDLTTEASSAAGS
ncbi:MAG: GNAT family N-acetyltransferase [Geminicoccaceae bacterium]